MKIPPIHSWGLNFLFSLYKKMSQTQVLGTVAFYMNLLFNHAEALPSHRESQSASQGTFQGTSPRVYTSSNSAPDTRSPHERQMASFALDVLVCNYRTGVDCRRGLIDKHQARKLIDAADTIHTNVKNGNLSPEEGRELLGEISNVAFRMKAEHFSDELDPNCKEKGREGSATQLANINKAANRPRNHASNPNMSPLSATPPSAAQKINATRAEREAKSKGTSPSSSNTDPQSTRNTM